MAIVQGDKVCHLNMPVRGLGKVLEVTPDSKARIFFINAGEKLLALKHVPLEKVEGTESEHPILDNPTLAERARGKKHVGLPDAKLEFEHFFPKGFEDPDYFNQERNYKLEAHRLLRELLGPEPFGRLLAEQAYSEIAKRALQVINKTNLIFPNEKMALKDGLKKAPDNEAIFAQALFALLYDSGPMPERFMGFSGCLERLEAAKWTTATYLLFLAFPEEHMFLKPTVTQHAADLLKAELNYRPELNWRTYGCLLAFAGYLKGELIKIGMAPRDMIDVQSFMWCIAPGKYE